VFDPLAIMMLLAATESLKWAREKPAEPEEDSPAEYEPDDGRLTDDQIEQIRESAVQKEFDINDHPYLFTPTGSPTPPGIDPVPIQVYRAEPSDPELAPCYKCGTPLLNAAGIGPFCPNRDCDVADGPFLTDDEIEAEEEIDEEDPRVKARIKRWKLDHPLDTLKNQRVRLRLGVIKQLPWMEYPDSGFGTEFPVDAKRGDTFVRIDVQPTVVYKFNGQTWMEVDKNLSDSYTYDDAYINYLIEKIDLGQYDPDLLSDSERDQVAEQLRKSTPNNEN
jgi:hypothetical protein